MSSYFAVNRQWLMKALSPLAMALVFMVASLAVYDYYLGKKSLSAELGLLAKITLHRSLTALASEDEAQLAQNLQDLLLNPAIRKACLYNYYRQAPYSAQRPSLGQCEQRASNELFETDNVYSLSISETYQLEGKNIALLTIEAAINQPQWHWLLLLTLLTMALAGFFWWLNQRYYHQLSLPTISLTIKPESLQVGVSTTQYVSSIGDEELQRLITVFNELPDITREKKEQMQELVIRLKDKLLQLEFKAASFAEKDKAIRQMFAGASHDLRQPLQAMMIFTETLKQTMTEEQAKVVTNLGLAINNLNSMFTDLLDISKLESRIENVRFAPVYVKPLLERVYQEFTVLAQEKGLTLRLHCHDLIVESNDTMLERMVRNLLSNAIRYTEKGGVLLTCRLKQGQVSIEVWDTGSGIPKEKMQTVFEQFVQLDRGGQSGQQGLGLGLSIIKRLNDLMGHQLSVDSREGRGSVFRIAAPVYRKRKRRSVAQPITDIDTTVAPVEFAQNLSIILIDDDQAIRESIEALLISWGMSVISFDSVNAIWDYFAQATAVTADLIISDFQIGRTETAFDAIAILRVNLLEQVPVLMITGTTEEAILEEIKESGYPYLKKPVKPAKLRAMMQYVINSAAAS